MLARLPKLVPLNHTEYHVMDARFSVCNKPYVHRICAVCMCMACILTQPSVSAECLYLPITNDCFSLVASIIMYGSTMSAIWLASSLAILNEACVISMYTWSKSPWVNREEAITSYKVQVQSASIWMRWPPFYDVRNVLSRGCKVNEEMIASTYALHNKLCLIHKKSAVPSRQFDLHRTPKRPCSHGGADLSSTYAWPMFAAPSTWSCSCASVAKLALPNALHIRRFADKQRNNNTKKDTPLDVLRFILTCHRPAGWNTWSSIACVLRMVRVWGAFSPKDHGKP